MIIPAADNQESLCQSLISLSFPYDVHHLREQNQLKEVFSALSEDSSFHESRKLAEAGLPVVDMLQAMSMQRNLLRVSAGFSVVISLVEFYRARLKNESSSKHRYSILASFVQTFLIGFINRLNRFNDALGVRYLGDYAL